MSELPLIAVLDYGIGNLRSAQKALQHCGADARLTVDHGLIADADAVVLPGVGAFGACMAALRDADLEDAVEEAVDSGRPFLGICVGMQMLFWLGTELPRPQMQWNLLTLTLPDDPMFTGLPAEPWVYFVHSLHAVPDDPEVIAATCSYGGVVNAAFRRDNVFATQFHPEKSGAWGLAMLGNFVHIAAETSVR
jgi:glutamine amidotransferase